MGKPSARLTDMTAHGGTIMGPGVPTVMVGKMPAATILDTHVCPMVTGVVPHVGGPMTLGSMGVFIGKKPAGRVGDMKVCVGPPSLVMMGCFTVLIGEAGGGSGGSAGSAAAAEAAKVKGPASIEPFPTNEPEPGTELHYCNFQFTDSAGLPLAGIPYKFKGPDNAERAGCSGPGGEALYSGFTKAGSYKVTAMVLKDAKWSKSKAPVGEEIELTVAADGFEDGTPGAITITKKDDAGVEHMLAHLAGKVEGKQLKAKWKIDVADAFEAPVKEKPERKEEYCQFTAYAGGSVAVSGKLEVHTDLDIEMVDEIGQPLEKQKVEVVLSNGEVKNLELDDQGKAKVPNIPANTSKVSLAPAPPAPPPPGTAIPDSYLDATVDLKKGGRDEEGEKIYKKKGTIRVHGHYILDLQQDLNDLGFPINGVPDGDFGGKTETAVKAFQTYAKASKIRVTGGKGVSVTPGFAGTATGIVDAATRKEIKLWKDKTYTRHEAKIYVKRKTKDIPVDGPGHTVLGEKVYAKGPDGKEVLLGKVATLQGFTGIGEFGKTNLYQALVNPATAPGIPTLTATQKGIWAALWKSEGAMEAINLYDSAFLSFGPMQQTMGAGGSAGELGGAMDFVKTKDAAAYAKLFGDFGLEPMTPTLSGGLKKGNFKLEGKELKTAADKAEYRRFIWGYRCVTAMADTAFRKPFLEFGFQRLDIIEDMTAKIGTTTYNFKDVYKSDLARALLLDAHINGPAWVDSDSGFWVKAMKKVKTDAATNKLDVSNVTADDEWKMIKEILALRASSAMWDPKLRAGYIILCCKGFDVEATRKDIVDKLGFASVADFLKSIKPKSAPATDAGISQKTSEKYYYKTLGVPA
jgi:peptidoglycan hydrolase-like protein with peptidoglycan-binding domain/uncharacterized Zn-binding protein involved in type VI secretion